MADEVQDPRNADEASDKSARDDQSITDQPANEDFSHLFLSKDFKKQPENDFLPYRVYTSSREQIDNFVSLTEITFALSRELLSSKPEDALQKRKVPESVKEIWSHGPGDRIIESIEFVKGWVRYEEYAKLAEMDVSSVQVAAEKGELGPVRVYKDGHRLLLWPPELHGLPEDEQPALEARSYSATVEIQASVPLAYGTNDPQELQDAYLRAAYALGKPDEVTERAEEMLYRSAFLLQWIVFEVFLRQTVGELIRRHPEKTASGRRAKQSITYEQLLSYSSNFSSINELQEKIIQQEIDGLRSGGQSVQGLINYLKSEFNFVKDPYAVSYVLKGKARKANYDDLLALRDLRNMLVHEYFSERDAAQDEEVSINEDRYAGARFMLGAICFSIANSIARGKYKP